MAGCQLIPYSNKEIDLAEIKDQIDDQIPNAPSFQEFISSIDNINIQPIDKGWDINSLLAALYFLILKLKLLKKITRAQS